MKYLTTIEVSEKWGISPRRIQQMCSNNELEGVKKEGKSWLIPADLECPSNVRKINNKSKKNNKKLLPLPIGISDYKKATTDYYYVDKTLFIKEFIDCKSQVSLFTRPRRFGKTLTMDMLRVFFEKTEDDTSVYFKDKLIWDSGEEYRKYQGKYPVIFITFKDIKFNTWEETFLAIRDLFAEECKRHIELINSDKINIYDKRILEKLNSSNVTEVELSQALLNLSKMLYQHYDIEPIIILDEYDTPIGQGHIKGFYEQIIMFMRNLFSGGLKDNKYLSYGFLTGILRVAKESIFSGLNNLKIYSILDNDYSKYFGFTKKEVKQMLKYYKAEDKFEEVCSWYDGYLFGNTEIFNPWSVINYVSDKCFPKTFWQSTGSNEIIGEIIEYANDDILENLKELLMGKIITTYIDTNVIYPEVNTNPYSIYSFLLVAGYLKVVKIYPQNDGNYMCDIAIPNKEIAFVYEKEVLSKIGKESIAISIGHAIFTNDISKLQKLLESFMIESISSFDGTSESFYHGMMLGLCAIVSNRYKVSSNKESGNGRFDIELFPENNHIPGFLFEFKYAKKDSDNLDDLAELALNQIDEKHYDQRMKSFGINSIIKIGIAFRGKKAVVKCR